MKKIAIIAAAILAFCCMASAQNPEDSFNYSILAGQKHPRLFINKQDFKQLKRDIKAGDMQYVNSIHQEIMEAADKFASQENIIEYKLDESGRRLGDCEGFCIITTCAYAYRYTGDKKYLTTAEKAMNDLCAFPDWKPSHYLGTARIAFALGIGYDWLYDKLSSATRERIVENLREKAFEAVKQDDNGNWYNWVQNWNQVCNSGLVCAAIATYEKNPEVSAGLIRKAVTTNRPAMTALYYPDGANPEGPGYWGYGTSRQIWLNMMLDYNLGTDFGISEMQGFSSTGEYIFHSRSNIDKNFNFSDNGEAALSVPSLWYFASRFGKTGLLYNEVHNIDGYDDVDFPIMMLVCAHNIGSFEPEPPTVNSYVADGENPIAIFRTGWNKDDLYLGIKAGTGHANHGHLDVGEFVFDAQGLRWAKDANHPSYAYLEVHLKKLDQTLFQRDQEALRWQMMTFNNRYHNTLTINDKDHFVQGIGTIVRTWDDEQYMGAQMDITDVFGGEAERVLRTCRIVGKEYLEVIDEVTACAAKPANVRWNMLTVAQPQITAQGITLTQEGKTMLLSASSQAPVNYKIWSTNPKDYEGPTRSFEPWYEQDHLCGFEALVPAGQTVSFVTTLRIK